jgi:hypothetical protein
MKVSVIIGALGSGKFSASSVCIHTRKKVMHFLSGKILTGYLQEISRVPAHLNPHLGKMRIVRHHRSAGRPG